jgi:hypothetical protein
MNFTTFSCCKSMSPSIACQADMKSSNEGIALAKTGVLREAKGGTRGGKGRQEGQHWGRQWGQQLGAAV